MIHTKFTPDLTAANTEAPMYPEHQIVDIGYSPDNFKAIMESLDNEVDESLAAANIDNDAVYDFNRRHDYRDIDFKKYENFLKIATKKLKAKGIEIFDIIPDFGYSPYNLAILALDLRLNQEHFAKLLGVSAPKLRQHIAMNTSAAQFSGMSEKDWSYTLGVYMEVLKINDKRYYRIRKKKNNLFFQPKTNRPLKLPVIQESRQ